MSLSKCPKCGDPDIAVFCPFAVTIADGWIDVTRLPAECNRIGCDQNYWWYPRSRRITRRSK